MRASNVAHQQSQETTSEANSPARVICEYCAELFNVASPSIDILRHPLTSPVQVQPHRHLDVLQLSFLRSCGGRILTHDNWVGVSGRSALVAYPGERHGYELRPMAPDAEVTLIKLPAQNGSVLRSLQPLPQTATTLQTMPELEQAIDRLHRDVTPTHAAIPRWVADAAVVITAWPRKSATSSETIEHDGADDKSDAAVQAALSLIESRLDTPPSLEELSRAAHLSARQLARRFQSTVGRTPHVYITERRVARAKALLFDNRLQGADIAKSLGFSSHAAFSRWFRQHEGRTPGEFRADPTRY